MKLQLETDPELQSFTAELFTPECQSDLPCTRLDHNVLHTDGQSFLSISVVSLSFAYFIMSICLKYRSSKCAALIHVGDDFNEIVYYVVCRFHQVFQSDQLPVEVLIV